MPACAREYPFVARVFAPVTDPADVVPGALERSAYAARDAGIEQYPHEGVSVRKGSTLSWPTSLLA